ncbi:MAG: Molybdenum cofactor biosynthesis enzyme MoaA [Candidatus Methanohalarchaeum thermophilum]|uniref:Probable GTP 3',8-cyclase n=1 Tax=Methanohalarchaeum thermophilum TaxID=1903181 RepID=A0A1Q6DWC5_METT1|nr:MAG: Molybdenum cofactor biosynthesis enzyme MoaA [Candidatus Methanohalarchaeum thermophilum]
MVSHIKDNYGRPITNIRFSITQRCNLNCFYCHQEGENTQKTEISKEKIQDIVKVGKDKEIRKVKITGGEPLVREDLTEIISEISPYLDDVSITTNGSLLTNKIDELVSAGLDRANISLDSLKPEKYKKITGGRLKAVLDGITAAEKSALYPIKINTVLLDGVNDDEISDFIEFAKERDIIMQFIEFHDTNTLSNQESYHNYHYSFEELEKNLREKAEKIKQRKMHHRYKYFFDGAQIELVKPMHNTEFCKNCTRMRVTSDGKFKPCLMRNDLNVKINENIEKSLLKAINKREPYFQK